MSDIIQEHALCKEDLKTVEKGLSACQNRKCAADFWSTAPGKAVLFGVGVLTGYGLSRAL